MTLEQPKKKSWIKQDEDKEKQFYPTPFSENLSTESQ